MRFAFVALGLALASCGGKSDDAKPGSDGGSNPPSTFPSTGKDVPRGTAEDPGCSTHSTGEKRADIPEGACVSGATCGFQTPAGLEACKPGVSAYAVTPDEWSCTCNGTWHCTVIGGSYGIGTCPGWEPRDTCASGDACATPTTCKSDETCFTSVQCGDGDPIGDAGRTCKRASGAGDDTCHVVCATDSECPVGQDCVAIDFWGCSDFNGASQGGHAKKICCAAGSSCQPR